MTTTTLKQEANAAISPSMGGTITILPTNTSPPRVPKRSIGRNIILISKKAKRKAAAEPLRRSRVHKKRKSMEQKGPNQQFQSDPQPMNSSPRTPTLAPPESNELRKAHERIDSLELKLIQVITHCENLKAKVTELEEESIRLEESNSNWKLLHEKLTKRLVAAEVKKLAPTQSPTASPKSSIEDTLVRKLEKKARSLAKKLDKQSESLFMHVEKLETLLKEGLPSRKSEHSVDVPCRILDIERRMGNLESDTKKVVGRTESMQQTFDSRMKRCERVTEIHQNFMLSSRCFEPELTYHVDPELSYQRSPASLKQRTPPKPYKYSAPAPVRNNRHPMFEPMHVHYPSNSSPNQIFEPISTVQAPTALAPTTPARQRPRSVSLSSIWQQAETRTRRENAAGTTWI